MSGGDVPDYELPPEAIAQSPLEPRDSARLLDALDASLPPRHRTVADLPGLLGPGDVVVINDSRVLAARLAMRKHNGTAAEVLLLETAEGGRSGEWEALVRPGRRLPPGTELLAESGGAPALIVGERLEGGRRLVQLLADDLIETVGRMPLPPYIHEPLVDAERYQTVYARRLGSVAAPTAGLHFTTELLRRCVDSGASVVSVDLQVGLGTFRPIKGDRLDGHAIHAEAYRVPAETMAACHGARRVVAIGTTCVRALESAAASGELEGRSELFIRGDYPFALVDVLFTNFHQPRSTLLALLESFCGPRWRRLYSEALASGYRFLSFGDAMIVARGDA